MAFLGKVFGPGSVSKFGIPNDEKAHVVIEMNAEAALEYSALFCTGSIPAGDGKTRVTYNWMFESTFRPNTRYYKMDLAKKRVTLKLAEPGLFESEKFPGGVVFTKELREGDMKIRVKNKCLKETNLETCVLNFTLEIDDVSEHQILALAKVGTKLIVDIEDLGQADPDDDDEVTTTVEEGEEPQTEE